MTLDQNLVVLGLIGNAILAVGAALYAKWKSSGDKLKEENAELRAERAILERMAQGQREAERTEGERQREAEDRQARKVRLWMFAHEAVELHRRWVLYAGQALVGNGISMSRPFEWIEFSTIEEYLRVGGRRDIVEAVYRVKQLNRQMDIQLVNAQESARGRLYEHEQDLKLVWGFLFNDDEWLPVCNAIRVLLNAADEDGNDKGVADLCLQFEQRANAGDKIRHSLNVRKIQED